MQPTRNDEVSTEDKGRGIEMLQYPFWDLVMHFRMM